MKSKNILLSSLLVSGLLRLTGCTGHPQPGARGQKDSVITVTVSKPSDASTGGVMASGQVEAVQTAAISTRVMGTITRIYVKVGDKVKKGQPLVTISREDIVAKRAQADAQIAGARADLENARKDYDRFNNLFNRQSATASEFDNATLRYGAAKSRLDAALQLRNEVEASMAYTRLTAPFPGVITQKLADEGSLANPGLPLLTLEQNTILQVSATIAESDISLVRTGDKAELEIKSTGNRIAGLVTQISLSSVSTGGQYPIKIDLPSAAQKGLFAGMYVNVFIPVKRMLADRTGTTSGPTNKVILVPQSALVRQDQLTGLYTISSTHTALLRWVRTGKSRGDKIEILSGLDSDESFILKAAGKLYNGASVTEQ